MEERDGRLKWMKYYRMDWSGIGGMDERLKLDSGINGCG